MKKNVYLCMFLLWAMLGACSKEKNSLPEEDTSSVTVLTSTNPNDPIILEASNGKGESVVLMGKKTVSGQAEALEQMVITISEEENPTEVIFDEQERLKEMIAPNGVRFQFEWLSESEAALTLIDPNTNEQLNTVIDFNERTIEANTPIKSRSNISPRQGQAIFTLEPLAENKILAQQRTRVLNSGGPIGNVYLEMCDAPATAQCWVNVYDYSNLTGSFGRGKYRGRFSCYQVGEGHYQFQLPENYNVHHDMADYCDAVNDVVRTVCGINAFTAPNSGAKQFMCVYISGVLASGIVSAPVAAGFLVACEVTSVALDTACTLINGGMDLPEGTPNLVDGLCGSLREMDFTWDTPLLLEPVVNALPSCIYGTSCLYEANGAIKDMKVTWGGDPTVNTFKLNPAAPAQGVSYTATAQLHCLPPGTIVTMDIVGTDGYADSEMHTVSSGVNYTATLYVPGAESGVRDVCTVTAVTPKGVTISKKASLIFH